MIWLHALLGTAFAFFVPGFALVALLFPDSSRLHLLARFVLGIALSIVIVVFVAYVLVLMRLLYPLGLWLILFILTVLLILLAYRRGYRIHTLFPQQQLKPKWPHFLLVGTILLIYFSFLYPYLKIPFYYPNTSSWRYMADALEIVAARGIPAYSIQWDISMPFVNNKIAFYLFSASWLELTGLAGLPALAIQVFAWLILAFALLGAMLFLSELVPVPFVALGLFLFFLSYHYIVKLATYTGEGFGIGMLFVMLWISHRVLFDSQERLWLWAPFLFAVMVLSHGVVGIVGIFLIGSMFFVKLLNWPLNWKRLGQAAYFFGVAGLLCLVLLLSTGGGSFTGSTSVLKEKGYLPYHGADPTEALNILLTEDSDELSFTPIRPKTEQRFYTPISDLVLAWLDRARLLNSDYLPRFRFGDRDAWSYVEAPMVLFVVVYLLRRGSATDRFYLAAVGVFLGLLLLWGLAFSFFYETWLPATHPERREFIFGLTANALLLTLALASVFSSQFPRKRILAVALSLALGLYFYFQVIPLFYTDLRPSSLSANGYQALLWLRDNTETDARLLSNVSTSGAFRIIANRSSLIEGRTTYLDPTLLAHSLDMLDQFRTLAVAPGDDYFSNLMVKHGVDYIVLAKDMVEFGGHTFFRRIPPEMLDYAKEAGRLQPVASFGEITIYRVNQDYSKKVLKQ